MRQLSHSQPHHNRAGVTINSQLYDRRALDAPLPTRPLISSLTHLAFLTSTSPRIRDILTVDGGLERLVNIAANALDKLAPGSKETAPQKKEDAGPFRSFASYSDELARFNHKAQDPLIDAPSFRTSCESSASYERALALTYTLAFQSLVNVGVRGSEQVRTSAVEAGVLSIAIRILQGYVQERDEVYGEWLDSSRKAARQQRKQARAAAAAAPPTVHSAEASSSSTGVARHQDQPRELDLLGRLAAPPSRPAEAPNSQSSSSSFASAQMPAMSTSNPPSRTQSPDNMPSSSASSVVADDAGGASSSEGEPEQDEEAMQRRATVTATTSSSMRARSSTIKVDDPPQESHQPAPTPSADQPASSAQPMDIDSATETETASAVPLSPTPTVRPLYAGRQHQQQHSRESSSASGTASETPRGALPPPDVLEKMLAQLRFKEEDVLLCLQLLAYLSKYAHVRTALHSPSLDFGCGDEPFLASLAADPSMKHKVLQAITPPGQQPPPNVFTLVERYTVRPASSSSSSSDRERAPPPTLRYVPDIAYWAGVIMRNACRKDDGRGGIRQCANMACGLWERYPREFAKCRRCRKAKYCSKSCQSKAWQSGHRFWCSARDHEAEQRGDTTTSTQLAQNAARHQVSQLLESMPPPAGAVITHYLEQHPDIARDAAAVMDLVQRYQLHAQQQQQPVALPQRERPRANSVTAPAPPPTQRTEATNTTTPQQLVQMNPAGDLPEPVRHIRLPQAYHEEDDDDDRLRDPIEAQADTMVQIADLDDPSDTEHAGLPPVDAPPPNV